MVKLRPARWSDLRLLKRWQLQPHVRAAIGTGDWNWEKELARSPDWREQFIAEAGGRPVGFLQIIDPAREDSQYWGCIGKGFRAIDLWIGEKKDLDRGFGTQIMKQAIQRAFADPSVSAILVDPLECNDRAHRFYERLGFEFVVDRSFDDDRCKVYRLARPGTPPETPNFP